VLIGPNNTGKSAFLSAIQLLGTEPKSKQTPGPILPKDRWGFDADTRPSIVATLSDHNKELALHPNQTTDKQQGDYGRGSRKENVHWVSTGEMSDIAPVALYGANGLVPIMQCPAAIESQGVPLIDDRVANIPAVLDAMLRKDRSRFLKCLEILKGLIPGLKDINIESPDHQNRRLDLQLENGLTIQGSDTSYGVRLMIFFVTLANHPTPPKTILLEEPENGVHPKRLEDIIKLLCGLTEGKHAEHPTQVIITTHSPYLLDYINPKTDQVLVAQRVPDGQRTITPVDTERLKGFLDEFMLGEIWINQEEHGLISK